MTTTRTSRLSPHTVAQAPSLHCERIDVSVVRLVGPDARRFANGMFTNNARDLAVGQHQFSALTDERGRLLGLMDVVCTSEDSLTFVIEGLGFEDFVGMYGKFIIFDDVEIEELPSRVFTIVGVSPPAAILHWRSHRGGANSWDYLAPEPLSYALDPPELLEAARIEAGWPRWPIDASDKQLPHELNLRDTHLHFEKGCYRGQEVINRLDVMGQTRKRLVRLHLNAPIAPGSTLLADGKKVGRMGSSTQHPRLGWIGLAVVRTSIPDGATVEHAGIIATVKELPHRG